MQSVTVTKALKNKMSVEPTTPVETANLTGMSVERDENTFILSSDLVDHLCAAKTMYNWDSLRDIPDYRANVHIEIRSCVSISCNKCANCLLWFMMNFADVETTDMIVATHHGACSLSEMFIQVKDVLHSMRQGSPPVHLQFALKGLQDADKASAKKHIDKLQNLNTEHLTISISM